MKKLLVLLVFVVLGIPSCDMLSELGGTVKGTVSDAQQGFVVLINSIEDLDQIKEISESDLSAMTDIIKGFGLITDDGSYEILLVPAGTYYVLALVDKDNNNTLDSTDMIGWYGKDTTLTAPNPDTTAEEDSIEVTITIPQTIDVEEKGEVSDIDITTLIGKADFEKYYDQITGEE